MRGDILSPLFSSPLLEIKKVGKIIQTGNDGKCSLAAGKANNKWPLIDMMACWDPPPWPLFLERCIWD